MSRPLFFTRGVRNLVFFYTSYVEGHDALDPTKHYNNFALDVQAPIPQTITTTTNTTRNKP